MQKIKIEYNPCEKCLPFGGKYIYKIDDNGDDYVEICDCYREYLDKKTLYINLQMSGLNADFIYNYNLSDYLGEDECKIKDKIIKYIEKFDEKFHDKSLYLWGENGTQKSTLASYIAKELIKKKKKVRFMLMNTFINELKEDFTKDHSEEYKYWYNDLLECDLLILDDSFDRKILVYKTGYQITFLDAFLRTRLERLHKSVIFTSNVNIDDIDEAKFSLSVKELVKRNTVNCVFHLKDKYEKYKNNFDIDNLWD